MSKGLWGVIIAAVIVVIVLFAVFAGGGATGDGSMPPHAIEQQD